MITVASVAILLIVWEIFGRDINPVFGSYPERDCGGVLGTRSSPASSGRRFTTSCGRS